METANSGLPAGPDNPNYSEAKSAAESGRESSWKGLINAAHFWEPRRLLYNLLLRGVVVIWVVKTWPHFRPAMNLAGLGGATVLALLANLCYCAAYLAEILFHNATNSSAWNRQRWAIWVWARCWRFSSKIIGSQTRFIRLSNRLRIARAAAWCRDDHRPSTYALGQHALRLRRG